MAAFAPTKPKSLSDIQSQMRAWVQTQHPQKRQVPFNAEPVALIGATQAPAYGAANQVQILEYNTQPNYAVQYEHLILGYAGPNPQPLPGDITWSIDVDRPLGTQEGYFERWYGLVTLPLGSFTNGWMWPVLIRHRDGEAIRIKAYTNQNVATGPGAFVTAALLGFEWPEGMGEGE